MEKLEHLKQQLKSYQHVAIAYSGGCDSHFLYTIARETLGKDHVFAVICTGAMMANEDIEQAKWLLRDGFYEIVPIDVFEILAFRYNQKERCYFCKKNIMSKVITKAKKKGFSFVLDGTNKDDLSVYRPGRKACEELHIISPLSSFTKQEIRDYSKQLNITTFDKPANACLASRFPYDTLLTEEKLEKVDKIESLLHKKGIVHVRCRIHDDIVRIEAERKDFEKIISDQQLTENIKAYGFRFVTLDLNGITSGSFDQSSKR